METSCKSKSKGCIGFSPGDVFTLSCVSSLTQDKERQKTDSGHIYKGKIDTLLILSRDLITLVFSGLWLLLYNSPIPLTEPKLCTHKYLNMENKPSLQSFKLSKREEETRLENMRGEKGHFICLPVIYNLHVSSITTSCRLLKRSVKIQLV